VSAKSPLSLSAMSDMPAGAPEWRTPRGVAAALSDHIFEEARSRGWVEGSRLSRS